MTHCYIWVQSASVRPKRSNVSSYQNFVCSQPHNIGFLRRQHSLHNYHFYQTIIHIDLNNENHILSVAVDPRKASGTVNHTILLGKLEEICIREINLQFFKNFLKYCLQPLWASPKKYLRPGIISNKLKRFAWYFKQLDFHIVCWWYNRNSYWQNFFFL